MTIVTNALVIYPKKKIKFEDIEITKRFEDEVLVDWKIAGLCNSERRRLHLQKTHDDNAPFVGGHEVVGTLRKGGLAEQRFVLMPHDNCITREDTELCDECRRGYENLCLRMNHAGLTAGAPGGFSHSMYVRSNQLFEVTGLSYDISAFLEPFACVIRGWIKLAQEIEGTIGIVGGGPIGMLHALYVNLVNPEANIYLIEQSKKRREALKKAIGSGTRISIVEPDYKVECEISVMAASETSAFDKSVEITKTGGKVLLFSGFNDLDLSKYSFNPETIHRKEFTFYADEKIFVGSSGYTKDNLRTSRALLSTFNDCKKIITGTVYGMSSKDIHLSDGTIESYDEPVLIKDLREELSHHIKLQYYTHPNA